MDTLNRVAEVNEIQLQTRSPLFDTLHDLGLDCIPYPSKLCFSPLIQRIEHEQASGDFGEAFIAKQILKRLKAAPELNHPIEDLTLLETHREVIELMMATVLPPSLRHTQLAKVSAPFELKPMYMTAATEQMLARQDVEFTINSFTEMMHSEAIVRACSFILNKFYHTDLHVEPLLSFTIRHQDSEVERHFKAQLNMDYVDVQLKKPLKPLSEKEINQLLSNIYDVDLWLYHLPPDNFEFHGIVITTLVDITEEEALSRMKYRLLRKDAIVEAENVKELEHLLKTYFGLPDLQLGVVALDYPAEQMRMRKYRMRFNILGTQVSNLFAPEYAHSIYDKVCRFNETLLIEDLEHYNPKTPIEKMLLKKGLRSIIVAPLFDGEEKIIGILEIASTKPFELHSFVELKLKEVVSLFTLAVGRSREEMDNRIEAILREQFTAIHPSVEWKFVEASHHLLERREQGETQVRAAPIVFKDVYPLYGQADIVGSSTKRNAAIQADMLDNLRHVKDVLERCHEESRFPLVSQLLMKVNRATERLQAEFNSQDETLIVELLQEEIHPLLQNFRSKYPPLAGVITLYFNHLDPELGIIYRKRRLFEESVAMLNHAISNYLSQEQEQLQAMLPHYFEKYQTDGVEFEMYMGRTLSQQDKYTPLYLKNFRLWQLKAMVQITRRVQELQNTLPVPLQTAQLIFAYTTPLSIRFRTDEKRFDVDGAYNVRYEILKKRIDKAVIEGTEERLTLPGKIAIVYLQDRDRQEYLEYLDYLKHEDWITEEVEELQIANLQGAQGLRALRVTVKD
jgi:hypothetical protein